MAPDLAMDVGADDCPVLWREWRELERAVRTTGVYCGEMHYSDAPLEAGAPGNIQCGPILFADGEAVL